MKVEEKHGFAEALRIDNEVWQIVPKIQARILKSIGGADIGTGMEALFHCFTTKLNLDGFIFKTENFKDNIGFRIIITKCPWYDLMVKSGREELSAKVGTRICTTEYSEWACEFDDNIRFELNDQICKGDQLCVLSFHN